MGQAAKSIICYIPVILRLDRRIQFQTYNLKLFDGSCDQAAGLRMFNGQNQVLVEFGVPVGVTSRS